MCGLSHRHTPIYYLSACTVRDCAPKCTLLAAMAASEVARFLRSLLFSLRTRACEGGGVRRPASNHVSLAEIILLTYHSAAYVTLSEKKDYLFHVFPLILHAVTTDMSLTLCSVSILLRIMMSILSICTW